MGHFQKIVDQIRGVFNFGGRLVGPAPHSNICGDAPDHEHGVLGSHVLDPEVKVTAAGIRVYAQCTWIWVQ